MTQEEARKVVEDNYLQQKQEDADRDREYLNLMAKEAWKHLLAASDAEWQFIEPKYKKVNALEFEMRVGAGRWGRRGDSFHWYRRSEGAGGIRGRTLEEMTEGQRIAEELIDLLEDPNSTDAQIRQKIDALHQVRENARKALPKARQELTAVLTTARQEAIFLLKGYID